MSAYVSILEHTRACVREHARYLSDLEDHTRVGFVRIIAVRQRNDRARLLHAHLCMRPSGTGVCGLQILVYVVLAVRHAMITRACSTLTCVCGLKLLVYAALTTGVTLIAMIDLKLLVYEALSY